MYLLNASRMRLLTLLPKGGVVAEVGVAKGGFAEHILRISQPDTLHLIDPWGRDDTDPRAVARMDAYRAEAMTRFSTEIDVGRVVIHRQYSTEAAPAFPDHTFRWVYVDAAHDFTNARADLWAFREKVAPDGFILGHDFSNNPVSRERGFGVVAAVRDFTAYHPWQLVVITQENAPSFLLTRTDNTTTFPELQRALRRLPADIVQELPADALDTYEQVERVRADGKVVFAVPKLHYSTQRPKDVPPGTTGANIEGPKAAQSEIVGTLHECLS